MNRAYALLGVLFLMVFLIVYANQKEAQAPAFLLDNEPRQSMALQLTSTSFTDGALMPATYTCDDKNISPPLTIQGVPAGTVSLVLVMDDPDIPEAVKAERGIEVFDHWVLYNLPPDITTLPEGAGLGMEGLNSAGTIGYRGPCPPTEYEPTTHRYIFRLYALSDSLNFIKTPTLAEVEAVAEGSILEKAELIGLYSRVREQ